MNADDNSHLANSDNANIALLKFIFIGTITGLGFGLIMAVVSNGFVMGVRLLSSYRESRLFDLFKSDDFPVSLGPLVGLLLAVGGILIVRRLFGIKRWHGPADAIHAAHRTDNELDVKSGFGSTLAAFISASGGASVGQYGPLDDVYIPRTPDGNPKGLFVFSRRVMILQESDSGKR